MAISVTNLPTRSLDELRNTPYNEMNGCEIQKLQMEDSAAFNAMIQAIDNPAPVPLAEGEIAAEPKIPSRRRIFRNGELVETSDATSYTNGFPDAKPTIKQ